MSNRIRAQHYIPRFYLRNFSIKGKEDYLYCFDKSKSKKFMVNVKNIGCESYFYDTCEDGEQQIEKAFCTIESLFNVPFANLVSMEDLSGLTPEEKTLMAWFVVTQELRTKEFRQNLKDSARQLKNKLAEEKLLSREVEKQLGLGFEPLV